MTAQDIAIRPAVKADARRIAELYSLASEGVSDYIWSKQAQPGEDLLDVGQRRYERRNTPYSYESCSVAEVNGAVIAGLMAYPMQEDNDYVVDDPVLKPFWILEEPGSYYIAGIAVDKAWRRKGIARTLMQLAEDKCRHLKLGKLSLICFESNTVALSMYTKLGYRETMRRTVVPHPLIHYTGDALLLVKTL